MELELQKYLRAGPSLSSLIEPPYSLIIKEKENLVLFKYTQGVSDGFNAIVKEARGIILDKSNNWNVVCHPFHRFYNIDQPEAAYLEGKLKVYEKVDGALIKLYYYNNEWQCATNGTIDAHDTYIDGKWNCFKLVEKALETYGLSWEQYTSTLNKENTYMYELVCPETRQVVDYGNNRKLYYLGERNMVSGEEFYKADKYIDNVRQYPLNSIPQIREAVENLGENAEGFVVVDENWNRVKVKTTAYFQLHYMANNGKPNPFEIILNADPQEFLSYFPWFKETFDAAQDELKQIAAYADLAGENTSYFWDLPRGEFSAVIDVEGQFKNFVFARYANHNLTWEEYTKNWDWIAWKNFLKKLGVMNVWQSN